METPPQEYQLTYFVTRIATDLDSACDPTEPVVVYFAGLGFSTSTVPSLKKYLSERIAKLRKLSEEHSLPPFLLVAPVRRSGTWWCIDSDELNWGWLGDYMPQEVALLNDFILHVSHTGEDRRREVAALGFSAGAYCITELLGSNGVAFRAVALGGVHGHGVPDPVRAGIPVRRRPGVETKWTAYLARIAQLATATPVCAVHARTDTLCPFENATTLLDVLKERNAAGGGVFIHLVSVAPTSRDKSCHAYEDHLWTKEVFVFLLRPPQQAFLSSARSHRGMRPRGTLGTVHLVHQRAGVEEALSIWCLH